MKIGNKIVLFYTSITVGILIFVIVILYCLTTGYIDQLYSSYLVDKAYVTAQKYWEKDEADPKSYQLIEKKYKETLPMAKEILLNTINKSATQDTLEQYLTERQISRLMTKEPITFKHHNLLGAAIYYPDNQGNFIVIILAHNSYGKDIQERILILMIILTLISCILIYLTGRFYSNKILAPIKHILKEIRRIRGSNLGVRIKSTHNKDELDELILTLNDMLDRIDIAFKSEKSFINNASHELNNPLTAIQGECEISLLKERSTTEYMAALGRIATESQRMTQLIRHLLFLSHEDKELLTDSIESIDLFLFLKELCQSENEFAGRERITFRTNVLMSDASPLIVKVNPHLFKIALGNIINNACKYSGQETVRVNLSEESEHIILEVIDKGIGIPEEEIKDIFQSFYRGSNTRGFKGQGIGLSLSQKILSMYNAKMEIESKQNEGTKVRIIFS
jgi:signal transduction histidine kinase